MAALCQDQNRLVDNQQEGQCFYHAQCGREARKIQWDLKTSLESGEFILTDGGNIKICLSAHFLWINWGPSISLIRLISTCSQMQLLMLTPLQTDRSSSLRCHPRCPFSLLVAYEASTLRKRESVSLISPALRTSIGTKKSLETLETKMPTDRRLG